MTLGPDAVCDTLTKSRGKALLLSNSISRGE